MALFRAIESVRPPKSRLFLDPYAAHFLQPSFRKWVSLSRWPILAKLINSYADKRVPGARTSGIARTRFIDDALSSALRAGIGQVVILGAGFDCRAYRLPEMSQSTVFEVDHPATLAMKLAVLKKVLPNIPENVRFAEIDFNRQKLADVLQQAGFQMSRPTVFLWEGVTNYLVSEAVDSTLRYLAGSGAGSQIIFTYVHSGMLDGSVAFDGARRLLSDVAKLDEPWTFGLQPSQVPGYLQERGWILDHDLSAHEYRIACFGEPGRRMTGYEFYHVAIAHVGLR